jgi:nucleotide-binding universal stress UspA family protein
MLKIDRVLVPTDFSDCSAQALCHGIRFAREHAAELHLLHAIVLFEEDLVNMDDVVPDTSRLREALTEVARNRMGALVRNHGLPDLVCTQVQRRGISAAPPIINYAREADIDLIVMGTHGRRGLRKMFLGSVAAEVVRASPCSVLTVRGKGTRTGVHQLRRILVPVDFSEQGKDALRVAANLARTYQADVQLLHVLGDILHPAFYNMGAIRLSDLQPEVMGKAKSELEKYLIGVTETADSSVTCHVLEGHSAREIVRFSRDQHCDLIVMATHGHTDKRHFLIGGTAEKVISGAECPVLSINPTGRALMDSGSGAP